MLGTLGTQEMVFIFLLALLLFGPKELPRIGRTVGKALNEFRRASNELKDTFDREMRNLEAESGVKEAIKPYQYENYNYDYSSYEGADGAYEGSYTSETPESATSNQPTPSEPATQGAELPLAVAPEGTVAQGSANEGPNGAGEHHPETTTTAEHNA